MNQLLLTLLLTFIVIVVALSLLGISYLLTGKSRLHVGKCGTNPHHEKDAKKGCGSKMSCGLCGKEASEDEE